MHEGMQIRFISRPASAQNDLKENKIIQYKISIIEYDNLFTRYLGVLEKRTQPRNFHSTKVEECQPEAQARDDERESRGFTIRQDFIISRLRFGLTWGCRRHSMTNRVSPKVKSGARPVRAAPWSIRGRYATTNRTVREGRRA